MAHQFEKKWRSQDVQLQENVDFSAMLLDDRVLSGLTKAGFKKPSPIQLEAIPIGRFGKDLLVQAKSGTGKTLVFVTVALEMLKRRLYRPQVLILAPTREIATQICSVVKAVGSSFPKLTCNCFIGGLSVENDKEKSLTSQIVVGTPGRIKQLITLNALPTKSIRLLVFDEADKLLDHTFKEEIQEIFNSLPQDKQVIATSATYPAKLAQLIMHFLKDPFLACLNSKELALLGIVHYAKLVKYTPMPVVLYRSKLHVLEKILKTVKFAQCLLFCNGVQKVEVLYRDVKKWGFSATYISSAKEQPERLKAIDRLKNFKCKVLVSSDVTARGIDAENVDLVINFDLSYGTETYLHRVGRAGRYGSVGVAITIVDDNEIKYLRLKEQEGSFKVYKLPDPVPSNLIQNPILGEYFIEDSECQSECSKKIDFSGNAHGECNNTKSEEIKDEVKPTSNKTLKKSYDVSANQTSVDSSPISEDIITPIKAVQTSSLNGDTKPKRNLKNISFNADAEDKTVCISDKTESVELSRGSSEINDSVIRSVDLCDNEKSSKDRPFECSDVIKKADVQISSKLSEGAESGDVQKVVVVESLDKSIDLTNNTNNESSFALMDKLNDIQSFASAYTDDFEANRAHDLAMHGQFSDIIRRDIEANGNYEFSASTVIQDYIKQVRDYQESTDNESASEFTQRLRYRIKDDEANGDECIQYGLERIQSEQREYIYKVFKKYQDDKSESLPTSSDSNNNQENEVPSVLLQDKALHQSDSASEIAKKEQNAPENEVAEKSSYKNVQKLCEMPNYKSTPKSVGKTEAKEASVSVNSRFSKPAQGMTMLMTMLQEQLDFSSSDDAELSDPGAEQNSSLEDKDSDSCSEDSSDFHNSCSSSSHSRDSESGSSSSSESCCSSCSSSNEDDSSSCSSSSSSDEDDCSSCSSESSTNSDTAEYDHAKKQKKILASRHSGRPLRYKCPHSQRPPKNLRSAHHCQPFQYYRPFQSYSEMPTNAEYQRYPASNTHETENHRSRSKSSRGHVCSGSCFLPSQHTYYHQHPCNYGQACLQWYQMFYYQWQHLQNSVFF